MDAQNILEPIKRLPIEQRGAGYASAQEKLIPDLVEAGVDVEKQKAVRDIGVREAASKEAQRQTGLQEEEYAKGRETLAKYELPTFKPTKEDLSSYAQLGSMIGTLGLMLGNSGKSSSRMAINSMSGMLNGWRQGRKDLYEKESKAFDQEFKRIGAIRKDIQNDIENSMKMWATKRKDAVALAETAAYKAGTDSVLGTMIRQGRFREVRDLLESNRKVDEKALETKTRLDARKEEMAQRDRQHRETMKQRALLASQKKTPLSPQQQSFEDMVSISLNEAAAQVENLSTMKFATTGLWQGRNTKGLIDAPLGVLANNLTTEDVQRYNAVIGIIGREAAKVLAGGRIITDKAADDLANQFKVRDGDKPFTVLEKIANIRQFFERAIEVKKARPSVSPEMQEIYIKALKSFKDSIPVTNKEVNEAKRQYDERKTRKVTKTFGDVIKEMGGPTKPVETPAVKTPSAAETKSVTPAAIKQMPSGEKLSAYAKANFEGNQDAAIEYLKSQGYK